MGTSAYPGALDNFSESSPTYMADPDATGRTHAGRHDDVESAVEQVEETLGVNPQGGSATVGARIAAVEGALVTTDQELDTHAANLDAHIPAGAQAQGAVGALRWDESVGRRCYAWDTVNSRWQTIYGDTGWRDITAQMSGVTSGTVYIRREGGTVFVNHAGLIAANPIGVIPASFHPSEKAVIVMVDNTLGAFGYGEIATDGTWNRWGGSGSNPSNGTVSYACSDPWPSSLPGTPVGGIPSLLPAP